MARSADDGPALFPEEEGARGEPGHDQFGGFCQVAVDRPMRCEYTYGLTHEQAGQVEAGMRVAVPFAGRRAVAVVVGTSETTDVSAKKLKAVTEVLDPEPIVDADLLELTRWMATYYACSWGEALAAVLPAALKRERGRRTVAVASPTESADETALAELEEKYPKQHRMLRLLLQASGPIERAELLRKTNLSLSPLDTLIRKGLVQVDHVEPEPDQLLSGTGGQDRERPENLTDEQEHAVERMSEPLRAGEYSTFLLRGVTGSGKTEVYLRVIENALECGKGAIVLVPEIALTPQTVGWFRSRFGEVAVLHSRMTDAQRLDMWRRVRRGDARVVVGARSAIFAPVADLGVVVVDEEHEPSFKQGNVPRYHARDVAVVRARNANAVCILGSATPSLESWINVGRSRYERVDLLRRVHGGDLPPIQIVDMRKELAEVKRPTLFSRTLNGAIRETLDRGEQAILFLNRRGYSPVLWCQACSTTLTCESCAVPMNFHKRNGRLVCHTCCAERLPPKECPSCTAPSLRYLGMGSERVEEVLRELHPSARVGRMDSDTMVRREDYETTLDAFGRGELDVLVGTQMIAKGLDFPRVTLVGVVSADSTLHLPDFRASERTFQLLSQVAGRAGRGDLPGRIMVQTFSVDHPSVVQAARHDYETFVGIETEARSELGYPPFGRLVRVVLEDEDEARARGAGEALAEALFEKFASTGVVVLGPAPAPLAKVRDRFRFHLLLKAGEGTSLAEPRAMLVAAAARGQRPRITIDVDPVSMM